MQIDFLEVLSCNHVSSLYCNSSGLVFNQSLTHYGALDDLELTM